MKETRYLVILILSFLLVESAVQAQSNNPQLFNKPYWDIGLEYGIDAGFGGNVGYTNLGVGSWKISHGGISILYKDDGIDRWGKQYESDIIRPNEYQEDIRDTGYAFTFISGQIGLQIIKNIHVIGSLEYKQATFVQKRYDDFEILSDDGRYYTEYTNTDKSGVGIGAGAKFFLPLSDKVAFTPMLIASTERKLSISMGLAF